jgi:plastocyanin
MNGRIYFREVERAVWLALRSIAHCNSKDFDRRVREERPRKSQRMPWALCVFVALGALAAGQDVDLKARVELTRNGRRMQDASKVVVWLTPVGNTPAASAPVQTAIPQLVQKNKSFQPSLLVIPAGGKVEFPNHDPFFHNVFSLFDGKRFDLGLYESGTTQFVQFDKPGISYIFCNIHAQMSAVVIALNTPYYGISGWRGDIDIANVAPGRYQVHVFHPSVSAEALSAAEHEITVNEANTFLGNFSLQESNLELAHKNKYGRDYDRSDPDNPAYARP